jgi:outer membrane protein
MKMGHTRSLSNPYSSDWKEKNNRPSFLACKNFTVCLEKLWPVWLTIGLVCFLLAASPGRAADSTGRAASQQPLSLNECERIALKLSPLPQGAGQEVLAAREAAGEARASYFPDLGLQSGYSRWQQRAFLPEGISIPGHTIPRVVGPTDDWTAGLRAHFILFDSGERRARYQSALAGQGVAEEEKARIIQDLILGVVQNYYGLAAAQEIKSVAEKNDSQAKSHLRLAEERREAGDVPLADVLRAQVEATNAELSLIRARSMVQIAKGNLNTIMGEPVNQPISISAPKETVRSPEEINLPQALEQAVRERPESKRALKQIEVSRSGVETARSAFGPKIRAEGSFGWRDTQLLPRDEEWLAGVKIEWPLFSGFLRHHRLARAKAELSKEEALAKQVLLKVRQEVWTAFSKLKEAYAAVQSTQALVRQAQESLRMAQERYEVGAGTITDLLDAQTALARALATRVENEWDYYTAKAVFQRALGTLGADLSP